MFEKPSVCEQIRGLIDLLLLLFVIIPKKPLQIALSFYTFCFLGEKMDSKFYFVLIITIPLIVAISTIILLFYLKR